ncbi:MAG: T9SS type A sorting domain-containing protein [Bacteroidales bacterium]|nr:T9SS type A sorting domain-containing protein [Bacteroidales bacterium]
MKNFALSVVLILFALEIFSQCANDSNIYRFDYAGHSYEVVMEMQIWPDAAACALERGGYLVDISSQAEQDAVFDAIISGAGVSPTYTTISNGGGIAYVWIGATDNETEGTWLWDGDNDASGTNFWTGEGANGAGTGAAIGGAYINWGGAGSGIPNEPDDYGAGQDCGAIGLTGWPSGTTVLGDTGEWNDIQGTSLCYYVIEYDYILAINENTDAGMVLYPNPAANELQIELPMPGTYLIKVFDPKGSLIMQQNSEAIALIDISSLATGVYFVEAVGELNFRGSFIKQ